MNYTIQIMNVLHEASNGVNESHELEPRRIAEKIRIYVVSNMDAWYLVDTPYNSIVSGKIQTDEGIRLLRIIVRVMQNCDLLFEHGSSLWIKAVSAGIVSFLRIDGFRSR